jgi:hypothetical protein
MYFECFAVFIAKSIFSLSLPKQKLFENFFFINTLRIKSFKNSENFIEIGCSFSMHVRDPKGRPIQKMDFFTLSDFKIFKVAR